ncbi:P-loop containing nucleoside triphosphate hydrolase protein [Trametes cingulata]|nr:P-loop containing nucleoside triphosphate hydrolase protein [Trametes cingulata]
MSERLLSTLSLPPPTLSALAGAGYETVRDLSNSTPEQLSRDLNIPLPASQAVFSATRPSTSLPMTQSAAAMMGTTKLYSTGCPPLDRLLGGGLKRGSVLEINGPPGSGKEQIAANAVKSFVKCNQEVLFVDMQNMVPPATIKRILMNNPTADTDGLDLVRYQTLHTIAEFVVFLRNLPAYLEANPATALLVLNSLAFPFQPITKYKERTPILERLKQTLTLACASMGLSVIITSQLYTRMLEGNGQPGSAPPGSKSIMIPCFGEPNTPASNDAFPMGRTYRVIIVPQTRTTGVMRLLSSPAHVPVKGQPVPEEPYQRVRGVLS